MNQTPYLNWQSEHQIEAELPHHLRSWLLYPGSFMMRLKEHGVQNPLVQIIEERWQEPFSCEEKFLALRKKEKVLIREVCIVSENKIWMFARTLVPKKTLTGKESQLSELKNRSLGSVLFNDPTMQRSPFELAKLLPGSYWHEKMEDYSKLSLGACWARRSLFCLSNKKLLLTEVFLPDIADLC